MIKKRMSPYELEDSIFKEVEGRRWATRQSWREVHKEALLLWVDKHRDIATVLPVESAHPVEVSTQAAAVGLPAAGLPAAGLPAAGLPAAGLPAAGLPAAGVPAVVLSENEKRLERLIRGKAQKQALLDEAPRELEREPGSLRALNWLKVMPGILASYDSDIEACKAEIEAERALSIKKVDNEEEGGEV